ncbi:MAG TPA: RdgB/HAM1 family non-canonical purine NTP pyrophosphatase [Gemmatimonadaceae bacterium]|nr:RdgB/HAM1 family non-canonical purine NTP pyrophosphatase [Gemmatimonadaceae bacterium]
MADSTLLLATRSSGKIREVRSLFASSPFVLIDLDEAGVPPLPEEDDLETANTFEENALAKARYFRARTSLPTIADDSGISVAALGGAPGVYSKRWSNRTDLGGAALDDANNALLIERLRVVTDRAAKYVCAAAFCDGAREFVERGEVRGHITLDPRGHGGFGYDPYFESEELGRTFGEVSMEEKARVSHRARAFRALLRRLELTTELTTQDK